MWRMRVRLAIALACVVVLIARYWTWRIEEDRFVCLVHRAESVKTDAALHDLFRGYKHTVYDLPESNEHLIMFEVRTGFTTRLGLDAYCTSAGDVIAVYGRDLEM